MKTYGQCPVVPSFLHATTCQSDYEISFTNASIASAGGQIASYYWDFGDGANSTATDPVHIFPGGGTYAVCLYVYDTSGCYDSIIQNVMAAQLPVASFSLDSTCANSPIQFTDLSNTGFDPISTWLWDFGDGNNSAIQNPVHTYASGGAYNVSLSVTTLNGCSDNITQLININPPPLADFSYSLTCQGDSTVFTDLTTLQGPAPLTAWSWDFGDGNTSSLQNPTHTYTLAGTYTVLLSVTDINDCSSSASYSVEVFIPPFANFSATSECDGNPTAFTDLSIGNPIPLSSWLWDFGDGFSSASQHPNHLFASAGSHYVTLTVVNQEGCSDTFGDSVVVYENPTALFSADTVCLGGSTSFTDLSQPIGQITSWSWDFGDPASGGNNISFLQNPVHNYSSHGSYSVSLTISDVNGCSNTISQNIWVEPLPIANFSFINEACVGDEVLFNDLSVPGNEEIIMWVWDFGDGTTSTIYSPAPPSVTHTYTGAGTFQVTLTVESALGCLGSVTKSMNVVPVPTADFTYTWACEGMQTQFNDISSLNGGSAVINWWWDFGDPLSGGPNNSFFQNPQHIFTGPGSYNVTLIVWNVEFCSDTIVQTVVVQPGPPVDYYYDVACENEFTQFYTDDAVVNISTITNFLWDFDDGGFSNMQNPLHLFPGSGTYDVTLTITDTSLCENSITKTVNVDPPPVAFFDVSEPTCASDSMWFDDLSSTTFGYLQTWIWDFDDGTPPDTIHFPDDPNVYHIYANTGTYGPTLTVINSQGCSHSYMRVIEIDGKPIANYHWSANPCQGEEVQFTDASFANGQGNIITWNWDFDDPLSGAANTSTLENPMHVFTDGGIYYVRLIVTNYNDCQDTMIKAVNVNASPEVAFLYYNPCEDTLTYFFPDSSIMNPSAVTSWLWEFGDGQVSTSPTPAHNYEVSGYYDVTLTILDTGVCTSTYTEEIFVNATPEALFDVSEITCENSPVYFDDLSSVTNSFVVEWTWEFGDGTDTTIYFPDDPDVAHTYSLDGTYQVTLSVVSEDTCYANTSQYVVIGPAPIALFEYESACNGEPTQFWDNSSMGGGQTIIDWFWDFGDPASAPNHTSTLQNPLHVFSGPGIYDVSLTVTNVDGCTDSLAQQVQVNEGAPVDFYSIDTCHNFATLFFVDTTITDTAAIIVYDWDFGDGSIHSSLMNPTHLYADPGTYDVTLIIYDTSGCSNAVVHSILVRDNPVALFEYETACTNDSTYFTDLSYTVNGDQIVAWEWDFGDPASGAGNYSNLQSPAHLFSANTTFEVKLVVTTDFGCRDSIEIMVDVYAGPIADYTYNVEYCNNGLVYFSDESISTQGVIISWEWYFEPGSYAYIPDPMHTFQQTDTTYEVSLTVTDANGCVSQIVQSIYVPQGFEVAMHSTQACMTKPMYFSTSILPASDSIFSYAWNFGDPASGPFNFSSLAEPSHIYQSPGWYTVTLTAIDIFGCPATIYDQVYVDDIPQPAFTYHNPQCDSNLLFTDLSFGNGAPIQSWKWDFGDGSAPQIITMAPGNTQHFYEFEGTYTVTLTIMNNLGCEDSISMEVERKPCIYSDFYVLNDAICERHNIYFADSSGIANIIEQWYWDFGDGHDTVYHNKAYQIHHLYQNAGEFEVRLIVSSMFNGVSISDTLTHNVTVHPSPETEFYTGPVCFGEPTMFYDSTQHSGFFISSWHWSFGTGNPEDTSNLKNPVFLYENAGEYDVSLITKNQYGCTDTMLQETEVHYLPTAEFEHSLACESDPINFTDLSDGFDEEIVEWDWFFNDPFKSGDTSDAQHPDWIYAEPGSYTARLVITNANGCVDTAYHDIVVNTIPTASFNLIGHQDNMQGSVLLEDHSFDAVEHHWTFGDGYELWGDTPPIAHIYEQEGAYDVMLVVWNEFGCTDTALSNFEFMFKTLFIPSALCPSANDPLVKVFKPLGRNLQEFHIAVHDTWGTLLWESRKLDPFGKPVDAWDGTYEGELLPTGVYIWRASARFKDGTIWEGSVIGNNEGSSNNTHGVVTLVR
ncbi:MAG: PKD domain-containing protein [Bacteroidota bacterium]